MRRINVFVLGLLVLHLSACGVKSVDTTVARTPDDVLGIWVPDGAPRELTENGAPPPLNEEAAALYANHKQRFAAGDAGYDPTTWCAGPGMPRILTMPYAFESECSVKVWASAPGIDAGEKCLAAPYVKYS